MAIYKANVQKNYTVIPNKSAQDKNLSFEARGMLVLLLSLPDDWQVCKKWLVNQSGAGRDKVNNIINELIKLGYMSKKQPKNQKGQFLSTDFFVYPEPVDGFAVNGFADNGKHDTTKETVNTKETERINTLSEMDSDAIEVLEHLNEVTDQKPRPTTKSHMQQINARLRDGHTVEDCKRVIEFKHRDWLGTEYYQYMMPKTLFSAAKFDGYLLGAKLAIEKTERPARKLTDKQKLQKKVENIGIDFTD